MHIGARTRTLIIGVVTAVWAFNVLAGALLRNYEPSESINGIFLAVVGGVFAAGRKRDEAEETDEDDKQSGGGKR